MISVPVGTLKACRPVDLDLFLIGDSGEAPILYRGRNYRVTREDFERLEEQGIHTLYLVNDQYRQFHRETRENLQTTLANDEISTTERFQVLQFAVAIEMDNAFRRFDPDEAVAQSSELGKHLVGLLWDQDLIPQQLFGIMRHDFNTFVHVINVSSYCILLAQRFGFGKPEQLEEIATGGLLHDIGKRHVPPGILNKQGRLGREEREILNAHPRTAYLELCERADVTFPQLMMAYQHHEKMDGTGYPVGVTGSEMHAWARLCAVVDVFDAVTGERPYRQPMTMQEALDHLDRIAGTHLDAEMVRCWIVAMRDR